MLLLTGCAIEKFVKPPWSAAVINHERFYGLNASIPYGGEAVLKVQLGWGSHTWTVLPVNTNKVYVGTISDTFKIGQELSPFSTTITEDVQTGWEGSPPLPRHKELFQPTIVNTNTIATLVLTGLLSGCSSPVVTTQPTNANTAAYNPADNSTIGLVVTFPDTPTTTENQLADAAGAVVLAGTTSFVIGKIDLNSAAQTEFLKAAAKKHATLQRIAKPKGE